MKTLRYKQYIVGVLTLSLFASCNFEKINTNEFEMLPEEGKMDGISVGGPITTLQKCVVPVGTQDDGTNIANDYQVAYHLAADCWSGYFSQNNNWNSGRNNLTYFLMDNWVSASYTSSYTKIIPLWQDIKIKTEKEFPEAFALAQILKVSAWHKATDMFGPIPYKEAGKGLISVPYDSQADVYKYMFEDLENAITVLTKAFEGGTTLLLPNADAVYGGNVKKWIVYANSLMLRLAMRVYYADETMSKKYVLQAVNNPYGVMQTRDDEAKMEKGAGLTFINNIEIFANQYNECRMGSSMLAYLGGYQDPRLPKFFKESTSYNATKIEPFGKYMALPTGNIASPNNAFKMASLPNINKTTPTYWMRTSEVCFLLAEAALHNIPVKGSTEEWYRRGIAMSFEENGVSEKELNAYINSGRIPMKFQLNSWNPNINISEPSVTKATVKWEGNDEQKLEKIMIQKWIALYPNGQEAWSEYRRTGYPKLHKVMANYSNGEVDTNIGIRRMRYPTSKATSEEDKQNLEKARKMLRGGQDKAGTRLWWDNKNK